MTTARPGSQPPAPHVIQLRGPWEYQLLPGDVHWPDDAPGETPAAPPAGRLRDLAEWNQGPLAAFCGRVRFVRRFGRPTGLAPGIRVELVMELAETCVSATLNGAVLGELASDQRSLRYEVTAQLLRRNELAVLVVWPPAPPVREAGGILGEVRLEIWAGRPLA